MNNYKLDPVFDLDNEEKYSTFYKDNQSWIYPEIEDYANEVVLNKELDRVAQMK